MRKEGLLPSLRFAALLGTVCALLLTGVGRWTAPHRAAHRRAAELGSLLRSLDVPLPAHATSAALLRLSEARLRRLEVPGGRAFVRRDGSPLLALRFEGPGLWGPISGYLSVHRHEGRLHRIVIHAHEETPGIGGRVAEDDFGRGLAGRRLGPPGKVFRLVAPGTAHAPGEVDGIAGATMTCRKLEAMVARVLEAARPLWQGPAEGGKGP